MNGLRTYGNYRNLNVKHKLRLMIMVTVTLALLCTCAALLTYDRAAARRSMRNDLEVMAEMLGNSSTAALTFGDSLAGNEILSSLRAKRQIVAAKILTAGGRPLGEYRRLGAPDSVMPAMRADAAWFEPKRLVLFKSISMDGTRLGTVYLEADLEQLDTRFRQLTGIMSAVLLGAWILAFALAWRLQGIILDPIAHLRCAAKSSRKRRNIPLGQ
jgi:hypothetical protein